jgi:hypothetical protein
MSPGIEALCGDKEGSLLLWARAYLRHGGHGDTQHHCQHYSQQHQLPAQHLPPSFFQQSVRDPCEPLLSALILAEISSKRH